MTRSRRRYKILLPTWYSDGSPVEPEKLFQTQEELVAAFGALTTEPQLLREDENLWFVVDVEATLENRAFFPEYKRQLKARFRQIDIWIVSDEIEVA